MERPSSENPANRVGGVRGICRRWRRAGAALAFGFGLPLLIAGGALGEEPSRPSSEQLKLGLELFTREWKPNDPRCHGGDGLGPVYNETSCVACHGQGGPGGAGPAGMNVEVLSGIGDQVDVQEFSTWGRALANRSIVSPDIGVPSAGLPFDGNLAQRIINVHYAAEGLSGMYRNGFTVSVNGTTLKTQEFDMKMDLVRGEIELTCAAGSFKGKSFSVKADEDALRKVHPGLVDSLSVVLHHFGVDPDYDRWRSRLRRQILAPRSSRNAGLRIAGGSIILSERNSPPLFGLGLIDALPDEVLVATAAQEPPQVRGKVSRMKSGRTGKFGWKAQTTSLREFVLGACASELGLEVPGHRQAFSPLAPDVRVKALDLTQEECDALVAYVQALPAPVRPLGLPHSHAIEAGRKLFESIGCADCHRPNLGNIEGIYSDLLLHDMGPDLISVTMNLYYGGTQVVDVPIPSSLADGSEWRTPPLWGYRDSGPYLHDGRAENLVQVVKAHKGQASESVARFAGLSLTQRSEIERFLNSLAAPPSAEPEPEEHPGNHRSMLGPSSTTPPIKRSSKPVRTAPKARADQERTAASKLKMAQTLEKMDKPQGALVFYREIVQDEPDSDAARTAAARIKALTGGPEGRKD
jgi:hypothetical protein